MSLRTTDTRKRMRLTSWCIGALFVVAAASQAKLQIFERASTLALAHASRRYVERRVDYAERGSITDAEGRTLACDSAARSLGVDFARVPETSSFFMALGQAAGIPASELEQARGLGKPGLVCGSALTPDQVKAVDAVKSQWRADGVSIMRDGSRDYPLGRDASGIVGRFEAGLGATGLEAGENRDLAGTNGLLVGLADSQGQFLPMRMDPASKPRVDGESIQLTIDANLQTMATEAVRSAVIANKAENGAAVVEDPSTGDILALASWPAYDPDGAPDPNAADESSPDFNAAIMARLQPGSTFKILTLAKGLDLGVVDPNKKIDCKGKVALGNPRWVVHCDQHEGNHGVHGPIDALHAISESCNVSAALWAEAIGYDRFTAYLTQLGLMGPQKIGLPGEEHGSYNTHEYAKPLQLGQFGFGQSLDATPIGLCSAFSMIGNGGVRMQPRLIEKIGDRETPIVSAGRIVSQKTADTVLGFMQAVIETDSGTGHALRIPGYVLAGKTGTAQKLGGATGGGFVSNFVGFVPAVRPKAIILVMINRPRAGKYYGASVAGPVFVQIARSVIDTYHIPPSVAVQAATAK